MVGTDTLKNANSSVTVFISVPTGNPPLGSAHLQGQFSNNFLLYPNSSLPLFVSSGKGRKIISHAEAVSMAESGIWVTESHRISHLPTAAAMALAFDLWLWGGITELFFTG